jgi:hypothetical protein
MVALLIGYARCSTDQQDLAVATRSGLVAARVLAQRRKLAVLDNVIQIPKFVPRCSRSHR